MTEADLITGQRLSAGFGWPHRIEDWALMFEIGGGFVAERDERVVGTAMAWRYGADAASVGMIMVAETLHGRGIGRRLLATLLDGLEGRTVHLYATREGLALYRALGFVEGGAVMQYQTAALGAVTFPPGAVRPVAAADLGWIGALDAAASGMDRARLLWALLHAGDGVALEREGAPVAVALHRRFGRGHLIGPVLAPDPDAACLLVDHLLAGLSGEFVRIDVPDEAGLDAFVAGRGLAPVAPVIGMTRGIAVAPGPGARTFALASQAYG